MWITGTEALSALISLDKKYIHNLFNLKLKGKFPIHWDPFRAETIAPTRIKEEVAYFL